MLQFNCSAINRGDIGCLNQHICGKHLKHDFCESICNICNRGFCGNVWESDGLAGILKDLCPGTEKLLHLLWHLPPATKMRLQSNKNASSVFATKKLFQYLQSNKNASSVFAVQQKCIQQYLQQKCFSSICQKKHHQYSQQSSPAAKTRSETSLREKRKDIEMLGKWWWHCESGLTNST